MPDWTGYSGTIFCDITETHILVSAIEDYLILCMFLHQFSLQKWETFTLILMHMMEDNFSPVCYMTLDDLKSHREEESGAAVDMIWLPPVHCSSKSLKPYSEDRSKCSRSPATRLDITSQSESWLGENDHLRTSWMWHISMIFPKVRAALLTTFVACFGHSLARLLLR